ncbi:MAG: ATP-binding protein, partial [Oscillospiraceae bacterium]
IRIHRVIDNILANALKFTAEGGTITYRLSENHMENKNLGLYRFEIQDTGVGIAAEQQKHIFEPFYRAQSAMTAHIEGTGLGLSIAKSIVDYMGGTISVKSEIDKGSTFIIELPLRIAQGNTDTVQPQNDEEPISDLSGLHILLCEDHPTNQLVAKRLLEKVGITVTLARDGKVGYDLFIHSEPFTFDGILMDIQMPVMNGYEATYAIRNSTHPQAQSIPIIAMTANAFAEDVKKSIEAGMNGHLAKPIEPSQLYQSLSGIIK